MYIQKMYVAVVYEIQFLILNGLYSKSVDNWKGNTKI